MRLNSFSRHFQRRYITSFVSSLREYCSIEYSMHALILRSEKGELTEEAHHIIKTIKQMEASLEDPKSSNTYQLDGPDLKVTIPLTRCVQKLKEKYNTLAKIHQERFEQVKSNACCPLDRRRLTFSRTCSSSSIIFIPSRAFLHSDPSPTSDKYCAANL